MAPVSALEIAARTRALISQARAVASRGRRTVAKRVKGRLIPYLRAVIRPRPLLDESSDVVISFTSFPARIGGVWAVVDTLFRQKAPLKAVVLVLREQHFPGRRIPASLERRTVRGLTILWVKADQRSYDKLLPTRQMFPDARIITVDDDKLYARDAASRLIKASDIYPGAIVGSRGRRGLFIDETLQFVGAVAHGRCDSSVLFAGGAGILYPPKALHADAFDYRTATRLCPENDDIWFWAMAIRNEAKRVCIASKKPVSLLIQEGTPALRDEYSNGSGSRQIRAVVDHFGLDSAFSRRE